MEIYSGNQKVIESGSIIPFNENCETEIQLKLQEDFTIKLRVSFEDNGGERDILKSVDEIESVVKYKCMNFAAGAGTIEPLHIATVNGKKVSIHLWAQRLSAKNNTRRIDYTVFIER